MGKHKSGKLVCKHTTHRDTQKYDTLGKFLVTCLSLQFWDINSFKCRHKTWSLLNRNMTQKCVHPSTNMIHFCGHMFIPTNLQMSSHPTLKIGAKKINSIYKQNLLGCAPKSSMEIHMIHIENSFGQLFMIPFIPFAPRITFFKF